MAIKPFQILQDLDRRCRNGAQGLPAGAEVEEDWVGIGFKLAGKRLIARMSDVAEILPPPSTIRVPGVKAWVKGLANIRGNLIPILDMNAFLQKGFTKSGKQNRILVINKDGVVAGLLVEEVYGLRRFKPEQKMSADHPETEALMPYLDGIYKDEMTSWDVFDVKSLVNHEPFVRVC